MRRIALLVLLIVLAATNVAMAKDEVIESFVIAGYAPGEFAVKGQIERQLNELVKEIKGKLEKEGGRLQVAVVGSADTTGTSVSNDRLAKDRAEQVAAVLSANFPEAKVIAWSKGDAENVRQVRVEYRIAPVPAPAIIEKPITVGIIAVLAAILILSLARRRQKPKKAVEEIPCFKWIDLVVDGEKYSVRIDFKDGKFLSPFTSKSGAQIYRDSKKGMIESLKGCLRKEEFRPQKEDLVRKGLIKVV